MRFSGLALLAAAALALARPAPSAAQQIQCPEGSQFNGAFCERIFETPAWTGHAAALSANALLGGLTAGVMQALRGGDFRDGFTRGALGGAVLYAGKRIAVQRFDGAGLVGREIGAVGSSIVRNAADGVGTFERLVLPLGPVRLYVTPGQSPAVRARLDAVTAGRIAYGIWEERLDFDAELSLSAGAPVFRAPEALLKSRSESDSTAANGLEMAGVLFLADVEAYGRKNFAKTFAHERVHVLQDDYVFLVWNDPAENWVLDRVPGGGMVGRFLDFNLSNQMRGVVGRAIGERENYPWEIEAEFLERHR